MRQDLYDRVDSTKLICWWMDFCIAKFAIQTEPHSGDVDKLGLLRTNVNAALLHVKSMELRK